MHASDLTDDLVGALANNPARRAYFASILGSRAAFVVVDMQRHWVDPKGVGFVAHAAGLTPNINRLAAGVRQAGGHVIWIRSSFRAEGRSAWPMLFEHLEPAEISGKIRTALTPGDPMHALWPALDARAADLMFDKDRFSAFARGASPLEAQLRDLGVDTVIIAGVVTNICCESTARDAMMLDFRTLMVADANAARTDAEHVAGLRTFAAAFGAVMTTDDVLARLHAESSEIPSL